MPAEGWFKDEVAEIKKKTEQPLITDFDSLISNYNDLIQKAQIHMDESYIKTIYPIIKVLFGDRKNTYGDVGDLQKEMMDADRLMNTQFGRKIMRILDNMSNLNAWNDKYTGQLEEFVKGLSFLCRSSFEQIKLLNKNIEEGEVKIKIMEDTMNRLTGNIPPTQPKTRGIEPPLTEQRMAELTSIYRACRNAFEYANLVNPKNKLYNENERNYFKEINQKMHLLKGSKGTSAPQQHTYQQPPPQPEVFSPLTQNPDLKNEVKEIGGSKDDGKKNQF